MQQRIENVFRNLFTNMSPCKKELEGIPCKEAEHCLMGKGSPRSLFSFFTDLPCILGKALPPASPSTNLQEQSDAN